MRKIAFVLALFVGVLSFSSTLTLKANAVVSGRYVTLYDLAATFNGVSVEKLKNFIVAFAPQPGKSYYLDAESIRIRAQQSIKWLKVFESSKNIKVTSLAFKLGMSKIVESLKMKLKEEVFLRTLPSVNISSGKYDVYVKNVSSIGKMYFALVEIKGKNIDTYVNVSFETTQIGSTTTLSGVNHLASMYFGKRITLIGTPVVNVHFTKIVVGKPFRSSLNKVKVPVNLISAHEEYPAIFEYKIVHMEKVVVAKRNIPFNTKITAKDVEMKMVNVYATSTLYATSLNACIGKISTWSFQKGQVLSLNALKTPPVVVSGEVIMAYVSYPGMMVTTFVRAMQDGNVGDVIAVRNLSNGYMFYGTIEKGPKICVYHGGE